MVEVEGNGFRATVNADNVEWLEDNPRGGTSAPMARLVTGDLVWYRDRDGKERPASIVKRHDDNFGPIFDIRLTDVKLSATNSSDMRESVLGHLRKRAGGSALPRADPLEPREMREVAYSADLSSTRAENIIRRPRATLGGAQRVEVEPEDESESDNYPMTPPPSTDEDSEFEDADDGYDPYDTGANDDHHAASGGHGSGKRGQADEEPQAEDGSRRETRWMKPPPKGRSSLEPRQLAAEDIQNDEWYRDGREKAKAEELCGLTAQLATAFAQAQQKSKVVWPSLDGKKVRDHAYMRGWYKKYKAAAEAAIEERARHIRSPEMERAPGGQ